MFEIKYFPRIFEIKDQGPSEDLPCLRKIFHITDQSRICGRSSISKVFQGHPEVVHDLRSFKIFGRFLKSKIFQRFSEDLRDQTSFEELWIIEIEDLSRAFPRSSRSNTSQGSSRLKINQGPSEDIPDPRSFKDV